MSRGLPRMALICGHLAAILAFASAAVTAYWLIGGTALLDTVGGALERLAASRSVAALVLAVVVVVAKVAAGVLALMLTRRPSRRLGAVTALGGAMLALYGAVLTSAGLLVLTGVIGPAPDDAHALRWHALMWDPWFLLWGIALSVAGVTVRRHIARSSSRSRENMTEESSDVS